MGPEEVAPRQSWPKCLKMEGTSVLRASKDFTRDYVKNGLNIINSVTFTATKYGKTIKLAEHSNERKLHTLGFPTGADKEESRLLN